MQNDLILTAYLELIKISIGTSKGDFDFSTLSNNDWIQVFDESKKQATALMCFDALKNVEAKPSVEIYDKWLLYASLSIKNNIKVVNRQQKLVEILNQESIPYVILKGLSSAYYYPDGQFRILGDVDFIVGESLVEKTKEILLDNNFILINDASEVHYEMRFEDVRFELHRTVAGIPKNKFGNIFKEELLKIIDEGIVEEDFVRPCDYHHGIVIFLHTLHHLLKNGIGVRHLCDWACYVMKTHKEPFWEEKLIPLLKSTGTFMFACGLTLTAVRIFGMDCPRWCTHNSEDMINTIFNEIHASGNFGKKQQKRFSLLMTRNDSGKSGFFSKLQRMVAALNSTNHIVCPLIKKVPIIYPFLMIYRVFRYLFLMLAGKKPSLIEVSKYADERSKVFAKYQLYIVEKE